MHLMPIAAFTSKTLGSEMMITCENPECGDELATMVLVIGPNKKSLMFGTDTDFANYCTKNLLKF